MGRELVPHLIDAGRRVTVWNRSPEAAETIGAHVAATAAEAVAEADAVVSVLFGPEAVRETITEAALPWRPGMLWIDVTTVSPADATAERRVRPPTFVTNLDIRGTNVDIRHESAPDRAPARGGGGRGHASGVTSLPVAAERRAASTTRSVRSPTWPSGVAGRPLRTASTNSSSIAASRSAPSGTHTGPSAV